MTKYEKQQREMRKKVKEMWSKVLLIIVVLYIGVLIGINLLGLSVTQYGIRMAVSTSVLCFGIVIGALLQNRKDKYLIPPPKKRESPEIQERIKDGE